MINLYENDILCPRQENEETEKNLFIYKNSFYSKKYLI